jgi:uncharacterized protein (DUF1778 family)
MEEEIDTMNEVCNTIETGTPGANGDAARRKRKLMKAKRQRKRQVEKDKKKEQRLQTPRQKQTKMRTQAVKQSETYPLGLSITDTKTDRVQIQFRCGIAIVEKIDRAAGADGIKRNDWLIKAVIDALGNGIQSVAYNPKDMTANREPILFRVGARVRKEIDKAWKKEGISNRTTWILSAILASLDKYDFSER